MPQEIVLLPIGVVRSPIRELLDDVWGGVVSAIELDPARFTPDSLKGLNEYSHVQIFFHFHLIKDSDIVYGARHPRGRADWPQTGIFAHRGKARPNRIGATVCPLLSVRDLSIEVEGLDAIDGTPVLDIKPYLAEFGPRGEVRQPAWATELMSKYWGGQP